MLPFRIFLQIKQKDDRTKGTTYTRIEEYFSHPLLLYVLGSVHAQGCSSKCINNDQRKHALENLPYSALFGKKAPPRLSTMGEHGGDWPYWFLKCIQSKFCNSGECGSLFNYLIQHHTFTRQFRICDIIESHDRFVYTKNFNHDIASDQIMQLHSKPPELSEPLLPVRHRCTLAGYRCNAFSFASLC